MAKFDLNQYETVKERKTRFYRDHPDGRVIVEDLSNDPVQYAKFRATLYLSGDDQEAGRARATGHAMEMREWELSQGRNGKYASVNYTSWTENAEESAIGRALDNAGYASDPSQKTGAQPGPSREEMEKVQRAQDAMLGEQGHSAPAEPEPDDGADVREQIDKMISDAVEEGLIPATGEKSAETMQGILAKKHSRQVLEAYANSLHRRFEALRSEKKERAAVESEQKELAGEIY